MKKLLAMILSVLMVLTLVPADIRETKAEGSHPDITNFQYSDGIMTWDAVPHAVYYNISFYDDIHAVGAGSYEPRFDVNYYFKFSNIKSGTYQIYVEAVDANGHILANSHSPSFEFTNENQCPDPTNVHWDGYVLRWDDLGPEFGYSVWLYYNDNSGDAWSGWSYVNYGQNWYDASALLEDKSTMYSIGVVTRRGDWADSYRIMSTKIPGRFTKKDISLSVSGDILTFSDYIDDEGNAPGSYEINFNNTEENWTARVSSQSFNFKDLLEERNLPEGYYEVEGFALSGDGVVVSNYSNKVYYKYGEAASVKISLTYYDDKDDREMYQTVLEAEPDELVTWEAPVWYEDRHFDYWSGSNITNYTANDDPTISFNVGVFDASITVHYDEMYEIKVNASPNIGGNVSGGGVFYPENVTRSIWATANPDYHFSHWVDDNTGETVDTYYSHNVSINDGIYQKSFTAIFKKDTYSAEMKDIQFYSAQQGYSPIMPVRIEVTNTGDTELFLDGNSFSITGDTSAFELDYDYIPDIIYPGNTCSAWYIRPVSGLTPGSEFMKMYSVNLNFHDVTGKVSIDQRITFTVTDESVATLTFDNNGVDATQLEPLMVPTYLDFSDIVKEYKNYVYPEATGYVFDWWYYDPGCDEDDVVRSDETFAHDTTLYAGWWDAVDTVAFTVPLPEAGMKESDYDYSSATPLENSGIWELDDFVWSKANGDTFEGTFEGGETYYLTFLMYIEDLGYRFQYDYINDSPNVKCIVNGEEKTIYRSEGSLESVTLWVPYTVPKVYHTVTFDGNGHGTPPAAVTVEHGKPVGCPADPVPFDTQWTFAGWCADKEGTTTYDFSTPVTSDITIYASWRGVDYTVRAYATPAAGGTISVDGSTFEESFNANLPEGDYSFKAKAKEEYVFDSWRKGSADGEIISTKADFTYHIKGNYDYYAIFRESAGKFQITFGANGGTGVMPSVLVDENSEYTLPECAFTMEGYVFHSWYIVSIRENAVINDILEPGTKITVGENIEIRPNWVKDFPVTAEVIRLSGKDRYETSLKAADELKNILGVDKFDNVVLATGKNFADALGGGYLAAKKNAPILLTNDKNAPKINEYINANLKEGGTVYVLGGTAAVSDEALAGISGKTERLSGKTRYDTSLAILEAAGVGDEIILVATGRSSADSLSASGLGLPMLLVDGKKDSLNEKQRAFLEAHSSNIVYILGGSGAVSDSIQSEITSFDPNISRISGATRYDTTVAIAQTFFWDPDKVILAAARDAEFPDGLCAGPLAYALKAPIVLTNDGKEGAAVAYAVSERIGSGYITGGSARISDDTAGKIFSLSPSDTIIVR
ncbi:MAG: cell wall-binding repeat-containing protein [Erysipelotrichaceae bacterium]|nr:cell wall-binding repeat-containing protein [Erysipelotrichaceae bacterium]